MQITEFTNFDTKEYFFSINHGQSVPSGFVPASYTLPLEVSPRESCPDGIINSINDIRRVLMTGLKEIANPEEEFALKRDCWKQPTPYMQAKAVAMSIRGHLSNIEEGIGEPKEAARIAELHLEQLEQINQIMLRTGPTGWVA